MHDPQDPNAAPPKRMRRPSVRLHQPYYENPGHRKLQRQWKAMKKDTTDGVTKKPRTGGKSAAAVQPQGKNNEGGSDSSKADMERLLNYDEELAIGNWKSFNSTNRERDFKRKRVRPSSTKKWSSAKTLGIEEDEIERPTLSSGGESKANAEEGEREEEEEEEEILGAHEIHSSEPSTPNCSFRNRDDDGDEKLGEEDDDDNAVGLHQRGMAMMNSRDSYEVKVDEGIDEEDRDMDRDSDGVRTWLNQLGLAKYVPLFKVHEVDDKVLPFLTLEDLKDMGVNAVGSRRKMYASIEKLGKGFQ